MEQSIQLVNAIALARGVSEPSNRDVFWLDESLTGEWYERLKAYNLDTGVWELIQRSPAQLLKDLKTVDGAGSGLDADTLRGFTPQQLMGSGGGGSVPELNTGQLLVGQGSGVGEAKTVSGIATIGVDGSLTFNPGSISHTDLANIGTNTHAQIDNHIANTSNPHGVTATQVGKDAAQWNADRLNGNTVNTGTPTGAEDGFAVTWDNTAGEFVLASGGGDSIYTADGATGAGTRQVTVTDILAFVNGQVKINALELTSTARGFLFNRVNTSEMNLITSPTTNEVVYNTDLNGLYRYDGAVWVSLSAGYGLVSVNDSSGTPTYYATLQAAEAAASTGSVISLHSDIILTSQWTITTLISINMNGYSISFDSSGTDDTIDFDVPPSPPDEAVIKFINGGSVIRTGGTSNLTNSLCMHYRTGVKCDLGTTLFYNNFGTAIYGQSSGEFLFNGYVWAEDTAIRTANAKIKGVDIYSNNGDGLNANDGKDYALDCDINTPNGHGCTNRASARDSRITAGSKGITGAQNDATGNDIISGSDGITSGVTGVNILDNRITSGGIGISSSSVADIMDNKIKSVGVGINALNTGEIEGNQIISSNGVGINISVGANVRFNRIKSLLNTSSGHGITLGQPSTHEISNNRIEVVNSSAFGILSSNVATFVSRFKNTYVGCAVPTSIATANLQTTNEDGLGEILKD